MDVESLLPFLMSSSICWTFKFILMSDFTLHIFVDNYVNTTWELKEINLKYLIF